MLLSTVKKVFLDITFCIHPASVYDEAKEFVVGAKTFRAKRLELDG